MLLAAAAVPQIRSLTDGWQRIDRSPLRSPWTAMVGGMLPGLAASWALGTLRVQGTEFLRMRLRPRVLFARRRPHKHRVVIFAPPHVIPWLVDPRAPIAVAYTQAQGRSFLRKNATGQLAVLHDSLQTAFALALLTGATVVYGLFTEHSSGIGVLNYGTFTPGLHLDEQTSSTDVGLLPHLDHRDRGQMLAMLRREMHDGREKLSVFVEAFRRMH